MNYRSHLFPFFALLVSVVFSTALSAEPEPTVRIDREISGPGWQLWRDAEADWKNDPLFFPAPALEKLPVNPPTGGWDGPIRSQAIPVSVPGTVEQYLQKTTGPDGDLTGVSWWSRTVDLPAFPKGHRVLLRFESLRERAEIFINRRLAGYDLVGSSPVEIDITPFVESGTVIEIAARVTDPGGNFDWRDSREMPWGKYALPLSHGFGGITGRVRLVICDPVYVEDIYVQNTPAIIEANALVTIRNTTGKAVTRDVDVVVSSKAAPHEVLLKTQLTNVAIPAGDTTTTLKLAAPNAKLWDVDTPNLYQCEVRLRVPGNAAALDNARQIFGFRWFDATGIGENAVLRLNGRRIVLRSAISWGFWPVNGIFPTEELAEKQVRVAKELGLNMLNFHRAIGNPVVFEKANELGLLYFEEPGAYKSVTKDPFGRQLAREKFLRMVRRDRSHPSLIIYNLINEWDSRNPNPDPAEIARHQADMAAAREIDPSRFILHTSAWSRGKDIDDPAKLHFRPFDAKPYLNGWYDVHHAGGPAVWNDSLYRNPKTFHNATDNVREIVFWGEEGAISTPPRLDKIKASLEASPQLGWDGGMYLEWHRAFEDFVARKNLRAAFPTIDSLTVAMGNISLLHQGKRIENIRLSDVSDGYTVNGWEAEIIENHSGIVDCFRNPKGDPAVLSYFNQPQYIAVRLRKTVLQAPGEITADFFAINEKNLRGAHRLRATLRDNAGTEIAKTEIPVTLTGGDTFGQLLAENISFKIPPTALGALRVEAQLFDPSGNEKARGHDNVWTVDWQNDTFSTNGAVWEHSQHVRGFLEKEKHVNAPAFTEKLPALDWIVTTSSPLESDPVAIPAVRLHQNLDGKDAGLRTTFFNDQKFRDPAHRRVDSSLSYSVEDGAAPDTALGVMANYGVRWEGALNVPRPGRYAFVARASGRVKLVVDGHTVIDGAPPRGSQIVRGEITLSEAKLVALSFEFLQAQGGARCELSWIPPVEGPTFAQPILDRVARDGTTLVILDHADAWMPLIASQPGAKLRYDGAFKVGRAWLGGLHFVREHPLMRGLPVNTAMDWPYQNVVRNGDERLGLQLEGEELVAGCYHSYPMQLGTAVGIIPLGRGRIIFSTLDIDDNLDRAEGPAQVARKLLTNFLAFASSQ